MIIDQILHGLSDRPPPSSADRGSSCHASEGARRRTPHAAGQSGWGGSDSRASKHLNLNEVDAAAARQRIAEQSILSGGAKLQWKVDWAMRWVALGVDYEMSGKDLID